MAYQYNRQSRNKASDKWKKRNQEKVKAYRKKYLAGLSEDLKNRAFTSTRNSYLKIRYGITQDQYEQMFYSQNCKCAICHKELTLYSKKRETCIDHNHITGKIRQILCHNCNKGIGHLMESEHILRSAIDYLNKWNKQIVS